MLIKHRISELKAMFENTFSFQTKPQKDRYFCNKIPCTSSLFLNHHVSRKQEQNSLMHILDEICLRTVFWDFFCFFQMVLQHSSPCHSWGTSQPHWKWTNTGPCWGLPAKNLLWVLPQMARWMIKAGLVIRADRDTIREECGVWAICFLRWTAGSLPSFLCTSPACLYI